MFKFSSFDQFTSHFLYAFRCMYIKFKCKTFNLSFRDYADNRFLYDMISGGASTYMYFIPYTLHCKNISLLTFYDVFTGYILNRRTPIYMHFTLTLFVVKCFTLYYFYTLFQITRSIG